MAKSIDVPHELRPFNKVFDNLAYRFDTSTLFSDYLDYAVLVFLDTDEAERTKRRDRLKDYYKDHYKHFPDLFREHILAQHAMVSDGGWYDLLGIYYEVIVSRSKSSAMGQFFTPSPVVDLMSQIIQPDVESKPVGVRVNDPACGSGRTLLSFHAKNPGNFLYGDDLDPMCSKMCAINFAMHGVVGQVCNVNSLDPSDWRFGYATNPRLYQKGLISLEPIERTQSSTWIYWELKRLEHAQNTAPKSEPKPQPIVVEKPTKPNIGTQLNFF